MTCFNCFDTGRSKQGMSPFLDCTHCGNAQERAELEKEFPGIPEQYMDSLWAVHQRARKIEKEASRARIEHLTAERDIARKAFAHLEKQTTPSA